MNAVYHQDLLARSAGFLSNRGVKPQHRHIHAMDQQFSLQGVESVEPH